MALKLGLILLFFTLSALNNCFMSVESLNVGLNLGTGLSLGKECSKKCESEFCKVAPLLRYGKYCGLLYSGCPGETPCDSLDSCCMKHDACIQANNNDYLDTTCNKGLLNCIKTFKKMKGKSFKGNTCSTDDVIKIISETMDAALLAGWGEWADMFGFGAVLMELLRKSTVDDDGVKEFKYIQRQDCNYYSAEALYESLRKTKWKVRHGMLVEKSLMQDAEFNHHDGDLLTILAIRCMVKNYTYLLRPTISDIISQLKSLYFFSGITNSDQLT